MLGRPCLANVFATPTNVRAYATKFRSARKLPARFRLSPNVAGRSRSRQQQPHLSARTPSVVPNFAKSATLVKAKFATERFVVAKPVRTRHATARPATAKPTTRSVTARPTARYATARPATAKSATAKATTKFTTARPTARSATARFTARPATARPSTARPTTRFATTRPTTRSATAKPTARSASARPTAKYAMERPDTTRPTTRFATARPTARSATARFTARPATARPSTARPTTAKALVEEEMIANHGVRIAPKAMHMRVPDHIKPLRTAETLDTQGNLAKYNKFTAIRRQFDISDDLTESIHTELGTRGATPTPIQSLAIPQLLMSKPGQTFMLAAETGSGKTLAYLIPFLHALKLEETQAADVEDLRQYRRPRMLILVPTSELVQQIGMTVKRLSHTIKLASGMILPQYTHHTIRKSILGRKIDVLTSTPFRLQKFLETDDCSLDQVRYLVLDEADTLLDRSFVDLTKSILQSAPESRRNVFCSATIPKGMDHFLATQYPNVVRIASAQVHSLPQGIHFQVVDCTLGKFNITKERACLDTLQKLAASCKRRNSSEKQRVIRAMVFVNRREDVLPLAKVLAEAGLDVLSTSRDTEERAAAINEFTSWDAHSSGKGQVQFKILVTTDLASRGIDTKMVKYVVLFDTPKTTIDFLHRCGRTGRAGSKGRAILILDENKKDREWLNQIQKAAKSHQTLE